jgi:formylglycine-generating enzyme required for sulfatase activity
VVDDTTGAGQQAPWIDPQGPDDPDHRRFRVVRGGSWREEIGQATTTNRSAISPGNRELNVGFRVVRRP